jgi:hypothetical protein
MIAGPFAFVGKTSPSCRYRRAFERIRIEFIDENGGGPGVRLRKRQRMKKPK